MSAVILVTAWPVRIAIGSYRPHQHRWHKPWIFLTIDIVMNTSVKSSWSHVIYVYEVATSGGTKGDILLDVEHSVWSQLHIMKA